MTNHDAEAFKKRVAALIDEVERESWVVDTINSSGKFAVVVEVCRRLIEQEQRRDGDG